MNKISYLIARFENSDFELKYRQHYLKQDVFQVNIGISIITILIAIFIYSDYSILGNSPELSNLLTQKILFILFSVFTIYFIRKKNKVNLTDGFIFFYILVLTILNYNTINTRPPEYAYYNIVNVIGILGFYIVMPNRLELQTLASIIYSIVFIVIITHNRVFHSLPTIIVIWASFITANIIGIIISWRFQISRRRHYNMWLNEKALKDKLQLALDNIKTLQGLLPICSNCKKIRDDKGYWSQIETYIENHSDVHFSHSLCGDCSDKLYGDNDWYKKIKG